ncbi:MAG TPA: glycosyltransferase family 39 protein [Segetibacter sp.]
MKRFNKYFPFFLVAGILLNANGLFIDILEPDGALYATIAKHIALSNDWINLFGDGHDWLDKPHFPFWIAAISFKIFGITAFAYKLPAYIFWLIGTWFTYRLAIFLYDKSTARVAIIIYIFSLHGILNSFDVRAEPYLTALSIGAIYYFYRAYKEQKWKHIIFTALLAACAIMTKGIFVLITIAAGFVIYWIITKQWKQFINYRWWIMVVLILLFITPELYSLYTQFDLHPEKVVFGRTNVSGLKFFFWDSQFGRFFNTGPIKGNGEKTFFLHTTLWAFLPWSIILYVAVFNFFKKRKDAVEAAPIRWIIYGSAAVTFLLFSFSGFQLPHYITILFPQFAIITAAYLTSIKKESTFRTFGIIQTVLLVLAPFLVIALSTFSKIGNPGFVLPLLGILVVFAVFNFSKEGINKIILPAVTTIVVLFIYLLNVFYPNLMKYQSGMMAGKWLNEQNLAKTPGIYQEWSYSFEFYAPGYVEYIRDNNELNNFLQKDSSRPIYTSGNLLAELQKQGYKPEILKPFEYFHITMLDAPFLNPKTRDKELQKIVLVRMSKLQPLKRL